MSPLKVGCVNVAWSIGIQFKVCPVLIPYPDSLDLQGPLEKVHIIYFNFFLRTNGFSIIIILDFKFSVHISSRP